MIDFLVTFWSGALVVWRVFCLIASWCVVWFLVRLYFMGLLMRCMYIYICIYVYVNMQTCLRYISATGPSVPSGVESTLEPALCPSDTMSSGVFQSSKEAQEGLPKDTRSDFLDSFLCHFFDIVLGPFFPDFGSNLDPTCLPTWRQMHENQFQEGSEFQVNLHPIFDAFFIDLGSLLRRFLVDFGCQVEGKVN